MKKLKMLTIANHA